MGSNKLNPGTRDIAYIKIEHVRNAFDARRMCFPRMMVDDHEYLIPQEFAVPAVPNESGLLQSQIPRAAIIER